MSEPLPIPDDFADHGLETIKQLCARYGRHKSTIVRWRQKLSIVKQIVWTDAEKQQVKLLVSQGMTANQIAKQIKRGRKGVLCAVKQYDLGPWCAIKRQSYTLRPRPADFEARWREMSQKELTLHYKATTSTLQRWLRELDLYRPAAVHRVPKVAAPQPKRAPVTSASVKKWQAHNQASAIARLKLDTEVDIAIMWLRTDGWSVMPCRPDKTFDPAGRMWLVGKVLCNADEVIHRGERAKRRRAA